MVDNMRFGCDNVICFAEYSSGHRRGLTGRERIICEQTVRKGAVRKWAVRKWSAGHPGNDVCGDHVCTEDHVYTEDLFKPIPGCWFECGDQPQH